MKAATLLAQLQDLRAQIERVQGTDDATVCANELRAIGCSVVSGDGTHGQPMITIRADDQSSPALAERRDALLRDLDARGLGGVLVVVSHVELPAGHAESAAIREATTSNGGIPL